MFRFVKGWLTLSGHLEESRTFPKSHVWTENGIRNRHTHSLKDDQINAGVVVGQSKLENVALSETKGGGGMLVFCQKYYVKTWREDIIY